MVGGMVLVFEFWSALWGAGGGGRWVGAGGRGGGERKRVTMKQTPEKLWMMENDGWGIHGLRCDSVPQRMETNRKTPFPKCMHACALAKLT